MFDFLFIKDFARRRFCIYIALLSLQGPCLEADGVIELRLAGSKLDLTNLTDFATWQTSVLFRPCSDIHGPKSIRKACEGARNILQPLRKQVCKVLHDLVKRLAVQKLSPIATSNELLVGSPFRLEIKDVHG